MIRRLIARAGRQASGQKGRPVADEHAGGCWLDPGGDALADDSGQATSEKSV
jgi:hypothetical protein